MRLNGCLSLLALIALMSGMLAAPRANAKGSKKTSPAELRTDYISRLQEQEPVKPERTTGSLWTSSEVSDLSTDYKARKVNDTVVILVSVQTTAAQSGNVNSPRTFQTASAITGLAGQINTKGLNPLFNANSATSVEGCRVNGFKHHIPDEHDGAGYGCAAQRQSGG